MKLLYVYQNYRKSFTGLGTTFLNEFKNKDIEIDVFEFKNMSNNRYINKIFQIFKINKAYFYFQNLLLEYKVKNNRPEILFIFKGTDVSFKTIKNIKNKNVKICGFNPDDPFNRKSCKLDLQKSLILYDYFFIWSRKLKLKIDKISNAKVIYLPFATDKNISKILKFEDFEYDISFIGNVDNERIKWVKEIRRIIKEKRLNINFNIFGKGWPSIEGVSVNEQVSGKDFFKVIRSSKCNLNILRLQNKNSHNMRTFEVPSSGGIMFHEFSEEAQVFFNESDPVYFFRTPKDIIDQYILNEKNIYHIQNKTNLLAHNFNENKNTYSERVNTILETIL